MIPILALLAIALYLAATALLTRPLLGGRRLDNPRFDRIVGIDLLVGALG